jgi:hypothetical protein
MMNGWAGDFGANPTSFPQEVVVAVGKLKLGGGRSVDALNRKPVSA